MKKHTVELIGLQKWLNGNYKTYAQATNPDKMLVCTLTGNLQVWLNGEVIWQGLQPSKAVEEYNKL